MDLAQDLARDVARDVAKLGKRVSQTVTTVAQRLGGSSGSNFKFAFLFLGPEQRHALEQVYRFCRVVDDIVDERPPGPEGRAEAEAGLAQWRDEVARIYAAAAGPKAQPNAQPDDQTDAPQTELGRELVDCVERFALPRFAFDEIIAGCAMDLDITSYANLDELELYCYRVASCVGILCIGIFGDQSEAAHRYARHLGLALQYTNILRDIGEDAARGRVYLPLDLLAGHGLSEAEILSCRYDRRFLALAESFAEIAEREYQRAWAELPAVAHRRALLPAEIMGRTYYQLLAEIRAHRYNVFTHRASLRRRDKLRVAAVSLALTSLPGRLPGPLASVRASLT